MGPLNSNFIWRLLRTQELVCLNGPGHLTKMAATPNPSTLNASIPNKSRLLFSSAEMFKGEGNPDDFYVLFERS